MGGFEFEWTGLLDGFESTIKEFPDVFHRNLSPIEEAMQADIDELGKKFSDALNAKINPQLEVPTGEVALGGAGGAAGKKASAKGASGGLAAVESRYLTMASAQSKTELHTGQLVRINNRHVQLTEKMLAVLERRNEAGMVSKITVSNFT